jgi:hypothetical protein
VFIIIVCSSTIRGFAFSFSNEAQRLPKRRSRFLAAMDDYAFVSIRFLFGYLSLYVGNTLYKIRYFIGKIVLELFTNILSLSF